MGDKMIDYAFYFEGEEYVTRSELVKRANAEGLNITERTVRYWAAENIFPRPFRVEGCGKIAFYPISLLPKLRALASTRPKAIRKFREKLVHGDLQTLHFGDHEFEVLPNKMEFEDNGHTCILYKLANGSGDQLLLIRKKDENG